MSEPPYYPEAGGFQAGAMPEPKPLRAVQAGGIIRTTLDNRWRTPRSIMARAEAYFGGPPPFDPASAPDNPTRALRYCVGPEWSAATATAGELLPGSGLERSWDWPTWVNPPYGRELRAWLAAIEREALRGAEIVGLLSCSRWEQGYFQSVLGLASSICLHRKRVAFISAIDGKAVGGNPYANMLVGWNTDASRFASAFGPLGRCFAIRSIGWLGLREVRAGVLAIDPTSRV